ncbi:MAG TPA: hypothetical protein VF622_18305 [Segetibacter sp.]|jgi:hypothetical protein
MLSKLRVWLSELSKAKQLLIVFICWWLFWFLADALMEVVWSYNEEPEHLLSVLLSSLSMTFFWVLLFHFGKVKRLFKKKTIDDR